MLPFAELDARNSEDKPVGPCLRKPEERVNNFFRTQMPCHKLEFPRRHGYRGTRGARARNSSSPKILFCTCPPTYAFLRIAAARFLWLHGSVYEHNALLYHDAHLLRE